MNQDEFYALPTYAEPYMRCRCGYIGARLSITRDIHDSIDGRNSYTPLYLCSACHWQQSCEYGMWERLFKSELGVDTWEVELTTQQFHELVMILFRRHQNSVAHQRAFQTIHRPGILVLSGGLKVDPPSPYLHNS